MLFVLMQVSHGRTSEAADCILCIVGTGTPPKYKFGYDVKSHHTGDHKKHHEHRHGDQVKGEYALHEPDGGARHVHYHADKHSGFHADVKHSIHHIVPKKHHH
ncbi:unnamed protein product [Spodoptera littoralis]|uniref:Cuticular protein n=1 Tax=Spodoptera littoralis TaxID=7109 RepID=A0A9P0IEN1_SPOLI|nr:unnamed protein product [Spodoptera littoralis]CAH1644446.1 unnamed protein product [Spodoptera littoralis]